VYLESQGEAGGTLPIIIVLDPPIPHSHFHRGWVYIDLDEMLAKQQVSYVGTSVASAEEWNLRQKYQGIARDVFGDGVRIKNGQVIRFRDTAARILMAAGWKPGAMASAMQAARILREHAEELASLVEISKKASEPVGWMKQNQEELKWQTKMTNQQTS
jgi:hypothetical protein